MNSNPYSPPQSTPERADSAIRPANAFRRLTAVDKQVLRFYIFYRRRPYLAWRPIVSFSSVGMLIIAALAYVIVQRGQDSGAWPLLLGVLFGALFVNAWYVTKSGTVVPLFSRIIDYQRVDQILEQGGYETADDTAEDTAEEDV